MTEILMKTSINLLWYVYDIYTSVIKISNSLIGYLISRLRVIVFIIFSFGKLCYYPCT